MHRTTETTRTFSFADDLPLSLALENHSGDVAVVLDAPEGTAEVTVTTRRPVDLSAVVATCERGRVTVDVPALTGTDVAAAGGGGGPVFSLGRLSIGGRSEPAHVEVHLPPGADVEARTKVGDVVLQGVCGTTTISSGSGDLTVQDSGRLRAGTGSGDIRVGSLPGGSLTSGSGDVTVRSATGPDTLEVRTGSGDVDLGQMLTDVTVATGTGDITCDHGRGSFAGRTGTGAVDVRLPRGIPTWLDLSSGLGTVHRDLDIVGAPEEGQPHLQVRVRTGTGDVRVHH